MKKILVLLSSLFITLSTHGNTIGHVPVLNVGQPDLENAYLSEINHPQQIGDRFSVSGATNANQIQWWGLYARGNTPTTPDNFTIRFFNITGGVPASVPLIEYSIGNNVDRTNTGLNVLQFSLYSYSVLLPTTILGPGDYLLSIVNNTDADTGDDWYWATAAGASNTAAIRHFDGEAWNPFTEAAGFAFHIGEPQGLILPDTGTTAQLLLLSVLGLFASARIMPKRHALSERLR